jgi:hypothetical protein
LKDNKHQELRVSKLAKFELEIVRFDTILDSIKNYFAADSRVLSLVASSRDVIFQLENAMFGLDVVDFCCALSEDPRIDHSQMGKEAA